MPLDPGAAPEDPGPVAGERTYPILPCPDLEDAVGFYEALGFTRTYFQLRPYPCAVVQLEDMAIHLSGIDGFDPATSVGSVVVVVPDVAALHASFAAGLRRRYGRLPVAGAPRLLRPRRKQGTATGFSLVDTGGNWLRFYRLGATEEEEPAGRSTGLARVLEVAARQGDARGDEERALEVLAAGLLRHPGAPAPERVRVLLYRCELLVRTGRRELAAAALAEAEGLALTPEEERAVAAELAAARELVAPGA
ncbi:hypothetical protein [Kineococcus glutinatus]|uniref:VOC family protein n=1 Tax=Kineococcus glutinatus TaxID=1070872 RepID=A0ABP8VNF9_9ACTN